ncbi:MAG: hypothetical protein WC679_13325 [Bacteroidales bacterium]|jgi:hypothetical protein
MLKCENKLLEYAQERYLWEHERKNQINNSVTIPLGIIAVQIGSISYFIANFPEYVDKTIYYIYISAFSLSLLSIIASLVIFVLHQIGYTYAYISKPVETKKYLDDYKEYYKKLNADIDDEKISSEIDMLKLNQYIDASEINIKSNNKKVYFYRLLLITSIISTLLMVFTLSISLKLDKNSVPTRVYIENYNYKEKQGMSDDSKETKPEIKIEPPKPPTIQLIKESYVPKDIIRNDNSNSNEDKKK